MAQAFENVRIIDFSQVLAGPWAATQLALLGADVVKIEQPGAGDMMRSLTTEGEWAARGAAPAFLGANPNKRAITLNLKHARAGEVLERLVRGADVVLENFRPGVMKRLGFDYDWAKAIRDDIIYCSVSGYGQAGPKSHLPAYDGAIQAASGIMSVTGDPATGPVRVGFMVVDMTTAMTAGFAIASALFRRQTTGEGQRLDVAMTDSAIQIMNPIVSRYLVEGQVPTLIGNRSQTGQGTADTWATKDGHLSIAMITDRMAPALCRALGHEAWAAEARYASTEARVAHSKAIHAEIGEVLKGETTETWLARMDEQGVPAAPVADLPGALSEEQFEHRGVLMDVPAPEAEGGTVRIPGMGFVADADGPRGTRRAPLLGEHTDEVLMEIGYDPEQIEQLRADGAV